MPDNPIRVSFLEWQKKGDETRQSNYRAFREYYDGLHDTQLTARQRRFLELKTDREFNVNYCPIVVNSLAERLNVTGFDAGDTQSEILWQWWQQN